MTHPPCATHLSKKEIPPQTPSGILTSSPALCVIAGVDLLCSGNFCRCPGVSKGAKAKDRALILPGICQLFALSAYIPCSSLPVLHRRWGHGPDRYRKFVFLNRILVSSLGTVLPYSKGEQSSPYMRLSSRNGCWGKGRGGVALD